MSQSQNNYPMGTKTIKYPKNIKILVYSRKITERFKIQGITCRRLLSELLKFFNKKVLEAIYTQNKY